MTDQNPEYDDSASEDRASKPRRSWMGLVVLSVFALVALFLLPWFMRGMRQSGVEKGVKAAGGRVSYGRRLHEDATYVTNEKKGGKKGIVADVFGEAFVENLTSIEMHKSSINSDLVSKMAKLPELEMVDLSGGKASNGSVEPTNFSDNDLQSLGACPSLKKLWINGSQVTDAGLQAISSLPDLWSLSLDETGITDDAMDAIATQANLKRLYMDQTALTTAGVSKLSGLSKLMGIGLQGTKVDDGVIEHLVQMTSLEEVRLGGTSVSNAAAGKLAGLPKLKSVNLENTHLNDEGLTWLADCQNLEIVDLSGTKVTNRIADTLVKMPKLITVFLHRTEVTYDAWVDLRRELGSGVQVQHATHDTQKSTPR